MRHPLSTPSGSGSQGHPPERPIAVRYVDGLVVEEALLQAVPEQLEPAVAEGAQSSVVALPLRPLPVVELAGPARGAEAAEGPLLDGIAEVARAALTQAGQRLRESDDASPSLRRVAPTAPLGRTTCWTRTDRSDR